MSGLIEALLSGAVGYGKGRMAKAAEEEEARRLQMAEDARGQRDLLDLLGRDGFSFSPGGSGGPGAPPPQQVGDPVAGPPGAGPVGALDAVMGGSGPPPGGAMPIPGMDVSVPPPQTGRLGVGSLDLGGVQGEVAFDPSQTREGKEKTRQTTAWQQLPREEYPVFIDGYDYVQEYGDWQDREREKREVDRKRTAVARALGMSEDDPDVEAIIRANIDPSTYRKRRSDAAAGVTPSEKSAGQRLAWEKEDRERQKLIDDATGIAASQAKAGQGQLEILTALRAAGFHHKLSDGVILGIIAKALKDYGF